ncbi:MAG: cytochrome-c oxidase, cbb3-type subunit III [Formosimonas sp.]
MSDFTSSFWSYWITAIALGGVIFVTAILISQLRAKTNKPGEEHLKPHVWDDDLQEYNHPMPRWWVFMFFGGVIAALVYFWAYPGLGTYPGYFKQTAVGDYQQDMAAAKAQHDPMYQKYLQTPIEQLAKDDGAMKLGERIFQNNCAQCHGSDAAGAKGFPNLTDSDWLYGGWPQAIERTILGGRNGVMPSQADALKSPAAINDVANYVLSLSKAPHDAVAAARGKENFTLCASCHTAEGTGSLSDKTGVGHSVGAPNLTDSTWLYGGNLKTVTETISGGRNNVMPSWECHLGKAQVHVVAAYVWSLNAKGNPTAVPDYLSKVWAEKDKVWQNNIASAKAANVQECAANSEPARVKREAAEAALKAEQEKAVAAAQPKQDAVKK